MPQSCRGRRLFVVLLTFFVALPLALRFSTFIALRKAEKIHNRGLAHSIKGEYDQAIADFTEVIRLQHAMPMRSNLKSQLGPTLAPAYANRGMAYRNKGEHDQAIADFTEAIRLDPKGAPAYYNRGNAYADKGEYDQAIADYNDAIRLNWTFAGAYYNLGLTYRNKGEHDEAIAEFTEVIWLDPTSAPAYYNRGASYKQKGDLDAAINDLNEAIRLKPQLAHAYHARGTVHAEKGEVEKAKADFAKAGELYGLPNALQPKDKSEPSVSIQRRTETALAMSDRLIVPGERIGPVRLTGKIDEVVKLFGPGTVRDPERRELFALQTWDAIGLWVKFDAATGNVICISVDTSGSNTWVQHATTEGICLGMNEEDVIAALGAPERTVTGGPAKSLYYDRRGIRFTVTYVGPLAGKVGALRIGWPSAPRGDTLIVPGERISSIEVGMPVDKVLAALGGGYHRGESKPIVAKFFAMRVYYWPHLGLSLVERSGRATSVRAARHSPADAVNIRYATSEDLGFGSSAVDINKVYGKPPETGPAGGLLYCVSGGLWLVQFVGVAGRNC